MRKWLIRTNDNHIFGPVSKEKILELYKKKTISLEDEICSGNGFWFYLRESKYLEAHLFGGLEQSFNPVSESESRIKGIDDIKSLLFADSAEQLIGESTDKDITLMTNINDLDMKEPEAPDFPAAEKSQAPVEAKETPKDVQKVMDNGEEVHIPCADDLAYPEMPSANPNDENEDTQKAKDADGNDMLIPSAGDLEYPDMGDTQSDEEDEGSETKEINLSEVLAEADEDATQDSIDVSSIQQEGKAENSSEAVEQKQQVKQNAQVENQTDADEDETEDNEEESASSSKKRVRPKKAAKLKEVSLDPDDEDDDEDEEDDEDEAVESTVKTLGQKKTLNILMVILIVVLMLLIAQKKKIFDSLLSFNIIDSAHAQVIVKKKT